ncbi:hypothetical protein J6590_051642 [Homalodisca vitripennis]|nr:hypothetical protein J6590_051642 [Homalodisca vitripennis]
MDFPERNIHLVTANHLALPKTIASLGTSEHYHECGNSCTRLIASPSPTGILTPRSEPKFRFMAAAADGHSGTHGMLSCALACLDPVIATSPTGPHCGSSNEISILPGLSTGRLPLTACAPEF